MKVLLKNAKVINVFTGEIENSAVLIENDTIIGVGAYTDAETDVVENLNGRYLCPGFIDGHIHIESTMLLPQELAKVCIAHGTSAIVADPHEIANVCGVTGIKAMIAASAHLPMDMYFMLPSCVPATGFDESGAILGAEALAPLYSEPRVLGLAEMMNYPGVIYGDHSVHEKLQQARGLGKIINGHAPLLSGKALDTYIAAGIQDDHECSSFEEASERIRKGQWLMIRQGTSARNLSGLIELFEAPYRHRCLLVTDDKHPYDLLENGHIDSIIRQAVQMGKSPIVGIQMATIQAAQCFGLHRQGAIAPGYIANLLVLNDLNTVDVRDVYHNGKCVCKNKKVLAFDRLPVDPFDQEVITHSFNMKKLTAADFHIEPLSETCRVIEVIQGQLLTNECLCSLDFTRNNGVDVNKDIIKIAVCERHHRTGHIGLGYLKGMGIHAGAIASSVSHDSHNLIIAGTNDEDMALAGNTIAQNGGGLCVVRDGQVLSLIPLPVAGLMSHADARTVAEQNQHVREAAVSLGSSKNIEPFMHTSFISLSVIPNLKLTTQGLVDVNKQTKVSLFV